MSSDHSMNVLHLTDSCNNFLLILCETGPLDNIVAPELRPVVCFARHLQPAFHNRRAFTFRNSHTVSHALAFTQ
jgi:hypothetical protein